MIINLKCPNCQKLKRSVNVLDILFKNSKKSLLAIYINEGFMCDHHFQVYINKNGKVRSTQEIDIQFEKANVIKTTLIDLDDLDINKIKFHIPVKCMAQIIWSVLLDQKIVLLFKSSDIPFLDFEDPFIINQIHKLFKYITQINFDYKLSLITEKNYKDEQLKYDDYIVLFGDHIINDPHKILKMDEIKIVYEFVSAFYKEEVEIIAVNILKKELDRTYELTKYIINFLDENQESKKLFIHDIESFLNEKYNIKIKEIGIKYLLQIIVNYYKTKIPSIHKK